MNILITGTSSGIGYALAREYLYRENKVYGISRTRPDDLENLQDYYHLSLDLARIDEIEAGLRDFISRVKALDIVILNAGMLPQIGDMGETPMEQIRKVMDVNLWSNKKILDTLIEKVPKIYQVVAISSGAAINGSRGWNVYAISKAALNMLIQLYSKERPETHFSALAPGVIDTSMQKYIANLPDDERFKVVRKLKEMRGTSEMPDPADATNTLIKAIEYLKNFESGAFSDVRDLYYKPFTR